MSHQLLVYNEKKMIPDLARILGMDTATVTEVYEKTFWLINKKIMEGKTVQIPEFGTFRLKHLGRRVSNYNAILFPDEYKISEEHFKIHFMACADMRRRADRKLKRQKKKAEEAANDNNRTE